MSTTTATVIGQSTMSTFAEPKTFSFGTTDYIVFVAMLTISASIGVYFGFFSKAKNTTDEYLMGGKKMKTIPIAISLVASQLSAIAIMSVPAESYSFGLTYMFLVISMLLVVPVLIYIVVPVFYENNISNCYEYLQMRFNKRTRQLVTVSFILNSFLMLPVYIFVPALAFSQVTGFNIHLINTVVCSICVFYTMLGGIKAVVWTDVVQGSIMLTSVILVGILGTLKTGGLSKVLDQANAGGRLDINYSWDPRIRMTMWNTFIGGFFLWTGHIGLNQSCVQRIVSLPSIQQAKKALSIAGVGIIIIMGFNSFIGIVMFARYYGCDPIKAGFVDKADKLMPFFVQDIMGHLKGMPGVFISCVFSAALSTMSANLNSLSGVVYFDYIRPHINHTDARANSIMKWFVVIMGCYCILGGIVVQKFGSIIQMVLTIIGISTGAIVGVFLLGMFVPRVNGKVAMTSIAFSIGVMIWIITTGQMRIKQGVIRYDQLPTSIDECAAQNLQVIVNSLTTTVSTMTDTLTTAEDELRITTAFGSNRDFSIFEISFYWYTVIGAILVWLLAIPLSYIWKHDKEEKINPKLYSPFVRKFLGHRSSLEMEEMPLKMDNSGIQPEKKGTTIIIPEKQNGLNVQN